MLILLILALILLTAVLYAQYRRSRALRRAARDLKEARMVPGTRLRLYSPDGKLEELLSSSRPLIWDSSSSSLSSGLYSRRRVPGATRASFRSRAARRRARLRRY